MTDTLVSQSTSTAAPIQIVRNKKGAIDTRKTGALLALVPGYQGAIDTIAADASEAYQADGADLGDLSLSPMAPSLVSVADGASIDILGSRAAVGSALVLFAVSAGRKAARSSIKGAIKVAAGKATWQRRALASDASEGEIVTE